ncbi:DUF1833 family protein [Vibrio breoganii]|uniref:DUF1833 family protein n=1 Tax=Vibrio breoganii TaxID=553239 RepID=UPI000C85FFA1|nr:DUF1833 family protein [Vibrio breoganii]PMK30669.1 hypothetical protein BCU03_09645 [Vibrio breoganii]
MRTLSTQAYDAAISDDGNGEVFLAIMHIDGGGSYEYHLVNNLEDMTGKSGQVYNAYPFDLILPSDTKGTIQTIQLTIDNVDRMLVNMLRNVSEPPKITLKVVVASTMDDENPEIQVDDLFLTNTSWDASTITGTLAVDSIFNQKFPSNGEAYSPLQFSGLF